MARGLTEEGLNFGLLFRQLVVFGQIYPSLSFPNCDIKDDHTHLPRWLGYQKGRIC